MNTLFFGIKFFINRIYIYLLLNPHLIIIIISTSYFLFLGFSEVTLCDDSFLDDLKSSLKKDIDKHEDAMKNFNKYNDLFKQAQLRPEKKNGLEQYLLNKSVSYSKEARGHLNKIRSTENVIKQFDSSFISKIKDKWYKYF